MATDERAAYAVVTLSGEIDISNAAEAGLAIVAVATRGRVVIIDLSGVVFVDCTVLGALLRAQRLARLAGSDVVLAAPRASVRRMLLLTGVAFRVEDSVEAAVASFGGSAEQDSDEGTGRIRQLAASA